jgi:hypothetical protein
VALFYQRELAVVNGNRLLLTLSPTWWHLPNSMVANAVDGRWAPTSVQLGIT